MPLSDLDAFRLELGDTDATDYLFTDDEAQYFIDNNPQRLLVAVADACDALARRFARKADLIVKSGNDQVARKYTGMADTYSARAKELRERAINNSGVPWHGGGSISRKEDLATDTDRVQPRFKRGEFDNPSADPSLR
jgi:hypothetical protein